MASSTFVITNNKGETISIPLDKLISVFGSASAPTPAPTSTHTMDISSDEEPIRSNPKRRRLARNKSSMECIVLKCKKLQVKVESVQNTRKQSFVRLHSANVLVITISPFAMNIDLMVIDA